MQASPCSLIVSRANVVSELPPGVCLCVLVSGVCVCSVLSKLLGLSGIRMMLHLQGQDIKTHLKRPFDCLLLLRDRQTRC